MNIPEIIPLIREFKQLPGNSVGGSLHIILDDGNIKDEDVRWCLDRATEKADVAAMKIASLLLKMSKTQRKKLSRMFYDL